MRGFGDVGGVRGSIIQSCALLSESYGRRRLRVNSLVQVSLAVLFHVGSSVAHPLSLAHILEGEDSKQADDATLWIYLVVAMALVLLGGAFAGLTIALMGQDEMYLQVIATSGEGLEKRHATKVLQLLKKGKHWVLVTLLVGNVITNETLPIVLDRSIGGGYAAVISSTVLVIIFGEIVPQSICVRYGLPVGAWMASFVLVLMWIFAPISWPIAKLLDRILGEDHGTTYKKAGLKTLVTLHKTMGDGERLNDDEVDIISGVLDLKAKPVGSIMTPMDDVFTLSANAVLDEEMMNDIMREGYSRIPIHEPKNKNDFVGMLLVKMLITYDPEDAQPVSHFSLATLPETRPETSCLDILNFFQQGKSHMVLVSDFPGKAYGALGVVTLEDVIEELIGEEIIDESDVFQDVHKAIRRMQPAPFHRARVPKGEVVQDTENNQATADENLLDAECRTKDNGEERPGREQRLSTTSISRSPRPTTFLMRPTSGGGDTVRPVQLRQHTADMREHLKHLGPSNSARQPKLTRVGTVITKPGISTIPEIAPGTSSNTPVTPPATAAPVDSGLEKLTPGKGASDGVKAVQQGYGTWEHGGPWKSRDGAANNDQEMTEQGTQAALDSDIPQSSPDAGRRSRSKATKQRSGSHSTLGSMHSRSPSGRGEGTHIHRRSVMEARSGSITENYVDSGAIKKLVLETTSSGEDGEELGNGGAGGVFGTSTSASRATSHRRTDGDEDDLAHRGAVDGSHDASGRQRRKWRGKKGGKEGDENTPLIEREF